MVTERGNKPQVSCAFVSLVIQQDPESQQPTDTGLLLERDVESLCGTIKILLSLTAAAACCKTQQPNIEASEILNLLQRMIPWENGLAGITSQCRQSIHWFVTKHSIHSAVSITEGPGRVLTHRSLAAL